MKQKKWPITACAALGLLVLCVGIYTWSGGDTGAPSEAVSKESGAPDQPDVAQTGTDLPDGSFEAVSVWVNWSGEWDFHLTALNSDKLAISSVHHLPMFRFEMLGELEAFKERFAGEFAMNHGIDQFGPSFADVTAGMDEAYFEDRTVFVVYVPASSGSYRFGVDSVYRDGEALCIHIEETGHPEELTYDMAGWFVVVSLEKALTAGVTDVDADLDHLQSYAVPSTAEIIDG